jgi:hypothetical protein
MSKIDRDIVFCPHEGPQTAFVQSPIFETVYGGARGGGKTFACLGEFILHAQSYGSLAKGLFLRRTREALKDAIREAKVLFRGIAVWKATRNEFHFNNGAVLIFNYLDRDEDAENYQGWQLTRLYVEELTQFADPSPIFKMFATLRSAKGVRPQFRATCNPGGPGHNWVKSRYVDNGAFKIVHDDSTDTDRVFIPARVVDNPTLLENDPGYVNRLRLSGNENIVKAWLEGDWSVIDGAFFTEWNPNVHLLPHAEVVRNITPDWRFFVSGDWGSAKPFAFGWYGIVPDNFWIGHRLVPRGAIVRVREYYGCVPGQHNAGLKMHAEAVARELKVRTREKILYGVLDPSAWKQDGGPSIAERLSGASIAFRRADNRRIARKGAMGGWDMVRARLVGEDDVPMFFVTEHSPHFLRTFPSLQHDKTNMEDVDTEGEDHIGDEVRYACMSRPWVPKSRRTEGRKNPFTARAFWDGITHNKREPERIRL